MPQQARRARMHTNKAEGHSSQYWASLPPFRQHEKRILITQLVVKKAEELFRVLTQKLIFNMTFSLFQAKVHTKLHQGREFIPKANSFCLSCVICFSMDMSFKGRSIIKQESDHDVHSDLPITKPSFRLTSSPSG